MDLGARKVGGGVPTYHWGCRMKPPREPSSQPCCMMPMRARSQRGSPIYTSVRHLSFSFWTNLIFSDSGLTSLPGRHLLFRSVATLRGLRHHHITEHRLQNNVTGFGFWLLPLRSGGIARAGESKAASTHPGLTLLTPAHPAHPGWWVSRSHAPKSAIFPLVLLMFGCLSRSKFNFGNLAKA